MKYTKPQAERRTIRGIMQEAQPISLVLVG